MERGSSRRTNNDLLQLRINYMNIIRNNNSINSTCNNHSGLDVRLKV